MLYDIELFRHVSYCNSTAVKDTVHWRPHHVATEAWQRNSEMALLMKNTLHLTIWAQETRLHCRCFNNDTVPVKLLLKV